ncbi:MAG: hypothetical protein F6K24_07445 [Okeania sp. SIO2D1]|nr:hypothetical protein [Okeania sp. SIO2D1]
MDSFGEFFCNIVSRLAWVLPDTPTDWGLASLAADLGNNFSLVGQQIFYEVIRDISTVLSLVVGYKALKVFPGRF